MKIGQQLCLFWLYTYFLGITNIWMSWFSELGQQLIFIDLEP